MILISFDVAFNDANTFCPFLVTPPLPPPPPQDHHDAYMPSQGFTPGPPNSIYSPGLNNTHTRDVDLAPKTYIEKGKLYITLVTNLANVQISKA